MDFKKFFLNFDYILFFSVIILTVIGILFIHSANLNKNIDGINNSIKQLIFFIINIIILFLILFLPPKQIINFSTLFYIICLLGLIVTLLSPVFIKGQKRLHFIFLSIQFSEFMKIALILILSKYYSSCSIEKIKKMSTYIISGIFAIIPAVLILLQPDLGTVLVYFPIFVVLSFFAGVKKRYVLYTILLFFTFTFYPVITSINKMFYNNENSIINILCNKKYLYILLISLFISFVLSLLITFNVIKGVSRSFYTFFYFFSYFSSILVIGLAGSYVLDQYILNEYQKDRIMIFFNPNFDPEVRGYHIIQSQITVGSGGFWGKGYGKGEMIQKMFLPEHDTDFIFPVIAEEKGFFAVLIIFFLYSMIFFRSIQISLYARHFYESYTIIGILTVFLYHILQNIGMSVGIMPITGIPLPFLSYGGSFLTTCYLGIAIIMNIHLNRYQF